MQRLGPLHILTLTAMITTVAACNDQPASPPPPPAGAASEPAGQGPLNYGEMALVGMAHKKFGDYYTYSDEKISNNDGHIKVCGVLTSTDKTSSHRYSFSTAEARFYEVGDDAVWKAKCDNGWEPGKGALPVIP